MIKPGKSDKLSPKRIISTIAVIIVAIQIGLFVISVPGYKVGIDEAWFGEQAYYMSLDGYVHSELFDGFGEYGQQLFVYHKLFVWLGSLLVTAFGFSLTVLRSISIISVLGLLGLIGFYNKRYLKGNFVTTALASLILLSCPLFFSRINNFRPELLLSLFGLACFLLLVLSLDQRNRWWLIGAGLAGGACVLVHLNGLIYVGAGVILLLSHKRPVDTLLFGLIVSLVASVYFADAHGQVGVVLQQFAQEPSHPSANLSWYQPVVNLLQEHKRLFRSPEIIGLVVLFILALIRGSSTGLKHRRDLVLFTLCLVLILGLSGHNKTTKYAILLSPFFTLVITSVLWELISDLRHLKRFDYWLLGWLAVYVAIGLIMNTRTVMAEKEYIDKRTLAVAEYLPPEARIMAPMKFIFNQIDNFDIRGYEGTSMILNRNEENFTPSSIYRHALEYEISHLVLDLEYCFDKTHEFGQMPYEQFEVIDTTEGFLVLRVLP